MVTTSKFLISTITSEVYINLKKTINMSSKETEDQNNLAIFAIVILCVIFLTWMIVTGNYGSGEWECPPYSAC